LIGRTKLAITLAERGHAEDVPEINQLLALALPEARRLRIPEAQEIENLIRQLGGDPTAPPFA
jgi:hypothetical protein